MEVGDFVNVEDFVTVQKAPSERTQKSLFESALLNTASAVDRLYDKVLADLKKYPPEEEEIPYIIDNIYLALDEIYRRDTRDFFNVVLRILPTGRRQFSLTLKKEKARELLQYLDTEVKREATNFDKEHI